MKKSIIVAGASMLLLSGLTAGVFAKYEGSATVAAGKVNTKQFCFVDCGDKTQVFDFELAPGESNVINIEVTNYNESVVSGVDMEISFVPSVSGSLADAVDSEGNKLLTYKVEAEKYSFVAGVKDSIKATLTFTLSEAADNAVIGLEAVYSVTAYAAQK